MTNYNHYLPERKELKDEPGGTEANIRITCYNAAIDLMEANLPALVEEVRREERERFVSEIEEMWSSLYGAYLNNQDLKELIKGIALTKTP